MPVLNQTVTIFLEMKIEKDAYKTWKKRNYKRKNVKKFLHIEMEKVIHPVKT